MSGLINGTGIPLSMAVFLATDNYDHIPNTISATGLIKSVRQIILSGRVPKEDAVIDIVTLVKSRTGTALHDAIEKAWKTNYASAMSKLGYPEDVIARVVINPEGPIAEDAIPVYMEQRSFREIAGRTVSGKYDFVAEGRLEDFKSTGTYTWTMGIKEEDYQLQGSIYRWLNPEIVTKDHMAIQFLFTDWMAGRAGTENYPPRPVECKLIPLMSLEDTEDWIHTKLAIIDQYQDADESALPLCSDKDLWRKEPEFKYYKNPKKTARSTKNFKPADFDGDINQARDAANSRLVADGSVGIVIEKPGEVVACKYCAAFPVCSQKDALIADGSLQL